MHERKLPRLSGYDYSADGFYFVTICTHDKKHLFGKIENGQMILNRFGFLAESELLNIHDHFPSISIDLYIIMPNHVHAVVIIHRELAAQVERSAQLERSRLFPTVSTIVGLYKSGVSRRIHEIDSGLVVWQKSFYDHIIRNEQSWREIGEYIVNNPLQWEIDEYRL